MREGAERGAACHILTLILILILILLLSKPYHAIAGLAVYRVVQMRKIC
jgi:hypothetical protein